MFYSKTKKIALKDHESAIQNYNDTFASLEKKCEELYKSRKGTVSSLENIEKLINSIANTPKDFEKHLTEIKTHKATFKQTEDFAQDAIDTIKKSSASTAAGVAGGAAIASLAPTAAMWVATTFGTASTGTAISALSGAAATNAALAWLGGGALAVGGGGMAAGNAFLALAGPIGWGIAGVTTATSLFFVSKKNKKVAKEAMNATKKIQNANSALSTQVLQIKLILKKSNSILGKIKASYNELKELQGCDYLNLSEDQKLKLGTLVNNSMSAAELLNEIIS